MKVVIANSRGVQSLQELVAELGPLAQAGTVEDAAAAADVVLLSIPLNAVRNLPIGLLDGKIVLDTSNYYPFRDGRVAELDAEELTTSELVASLLGGARYVKAFGNILAHHIPLLARQGEALVRTTLPIASNDADAKARASEIISQLGFDSLDAGALSESWRFEPESKGYTRIYLADPQTPDDQLMTSVPQPTTQHQVEAALQSATRVNVAERTF